MTTRRGFTLVEMLAAMAVATVLLGLAVGLVHRAMQVESLMRNRATVSRSAGRLARDFRRDVHLARDVLLIPASDRPTQVRLVLDQQQAVTYTVVERLRNGPTVRRETTGDEAVHYETYPFSERTSVRFSTQQSPRVAILTVLHNPPLKGEPPRVLSHCAAQIGRLRQRTLSSDTVQ